MKEIQIMHIVGNRPQFIKLAPLSKELHYRGYKDIIVHTGQHYDANMSEIFFEELGIDKPIENLQVGSGTHAEITSKVLVRMEKIIMKYCPSFVILYGDTDSTLAAALACRKVNIPIVHIEAGTRSYSKENPEEINRVVVDHISDICFCPDEISVRNLKKEGIDKNVFFSGDIMYDAFLQMKRKKSSGILKQFGLKKDEYVLMTWHRQENTNCRERMEQIIEFIERIKSKIIYPIHPRTKKMLEVFGLWKRITDIENLLIVAPVGYKEMVELQTDCKVVLTDSGGLSKESFFAGAKCLFMLDLKVWPDLEKIGWLQHINFADEKSLKEALKIISDKKSSKKKNEFYGNGHSAERIVDVLEKILLNNLEE